MAISKEDVIYIPKPAVHCNIIGHPLWKLIELIRPGNHFQEKGQDGDWVIHALTDTEVHYGPVLWLTSISMSLSDFVQKLMNGDIVFLASHPATLEFKLEKSEDKTQLDIV